MGVFSIPSPGHSSSFELLLHGLIPTYELNPVLMNNSYDSWGVQPCLAIHLDGHALLSQYSDDDGSALSDSVPLQIDNPGGLCNAQKLIEIRKQLFGKYTIDKNKNKLNNSAKLYLRR